MNEHEGCSEAVPFEQWIRGGQHGECRSCSLALVTPWYRDALKKHGLTQEAETLTRTAESGDPVQVARALDGVKSRVPPELSKTLRYYDCMVQQKEDGP